jgi:hypothetical protein
VAEVNDIVVARGMIVADGQVITKRFSDRIGYELFGDDSSFDTPPRRHWGETQRDFFGLVDPHQMADEPAGYRHWHVRPTSSSPSLPQTSESLASSTASPRDMPRSCGLA